jgi:membrane-bound lytic murein transglycosylase D
MLRNPEYLARVTERSQRYIYYITSTVESRNLPMELALLPMVESAFDPFAYSPQQAAGLWQFIPGTARHYGIKDSWWYDGRRDVIASTDAALNYLTYLDQLMGGNWLLAIASYNSGEGTVMRARKKVANPNLDDVFWRIKLPKETSAYVPRLLALAAIVDQPQLSAKLLYPVLNEPYFATMENTGGQLDLSLAADLAQVPIEEIYLLNPGFNRWATDPKGPHRLNVPMDSAERFRAGIDAIPLHQRIHWERYQVKPGDSLGALAKKFNTTIEQIQATNGLKHTIIVAGQHLLIPTSIAKPASYALSTASRQTTLTDRNKPGLNKTLHTVRSGDSYWSIARQYGSNSEQLARWNNRSTKDVLKIGEKLVVWTSPAATASNGVIPMQAKAGPSSTRKLGYSVRHGDSLHKIASRFSITVKQILQWNNLDSSKYLRPGQRLTLYVDVSNL